MLRRLHVTQLCLTDVLHNVTSNQLSGHSQQGKPTFLMAQVVWYPQSLEPQVKLKSESVEIDTISLNNAYEHVEQPLSKEKQQQEKPNKINLGQAHTLFTAHTAWNEELVLFTVALYTCRQQVANATSSIGEVRSGFGMLCM